MSLTTALVMIAKPALVIGFTAFLAVIVCILKAAIPDGQVKTRLFTHLWDTDPERAAKQATVTRSPGRRGSPRATRR